MDCTKPSSGPASRTRLGLNDRQAALLIGAAGIALTVAYYSSVLENKFAAIHVIHAQIISGTASAPYRYRIGIPLLAEGFSRLLSHFVSEAAAFQTSYIGIIAASLILSLAATYLLLRTWHEESLSLVVTLLIGLLLTVGFRDHFFQPWSLLEMALYTGALAALTRRRASAVFWIAIAATLNRETGIFLGFVALAAAVGIKRMSPDLSERLRRWALLALVGGATLYLSIRGLYGFSPPIHAPGELFASNIAAANLSQALLLATCMVGGIGYFIFRGWPYAPTVIKAALWGTIPHIAALLVFGVWHEVRLLFPFMGFVATFLSFGLQQGGRGSSEPVGSMANT